MCRTLGGEKLNTRRPTGRPYNRQNLSPAFASRRRRMHPYGPCRYLYVHIISAIVLLWRLVETINVG